MKYSLSSKVIFPWGGTGGELGDAARITLPGPGLGAGAELGGAARNTLPRIDLGADGELGDAARITLPGPGLGAGGELGDAARITLPGPGLGTGGELGGAARTTLPRINLGADGYQLLPLKWNRKMCDSILYAPMDELEFERLLGLATLFNDNDEWPIDFTELQELSELLGKLKSCVDVAIDNAPEGAKS
ncbi:hypothetical protein [Pseudomonas aeruginosa]|uniref:hypothetical protein n=1 Tax=Pseudomonas aeruginosa TaxID=287 RepID=UPI00215643E7|nr:hypothetical protein [Pseudomonas aeruginosa]MCV4253384.1 hypothetical protein [Pseudomonas aeruginosa]MDG4224447.1 hypothetical protein [Pseudomonas aeruginosa]MDG4292397.1 hypothetical protein [Pseudomonas aeruginosa]